MTIESHHNGVGRATLTEVWVPEFCDAVICQLPIPPRPSRSDTDAWARRSNGFSLLTEQRIASDSEEHRSEWRRGLPRETGFFDPLGEVFDGTITALQFAPQGMPADSREDFWSTKYQSYELNNLIGVDATGFITTAMCGYSVNTSDTTIMKRSDFFRAMQREPGSNPEHAMPQGYVIVVDSGFSQLVWCFAPFTGAWVRIGPNMASCRVYNFKLGQLRVVSENSYGRLKGRWTILRSLPFHPKMAAKVVLACCCLHNFAEAMGETVLKKWLTRLPDDDIGRVTMARLSVVTPASLNSTEAGKVARIEVLRKMGLVWVY